MELINSDEASQILQVSKRRLNQMTHDGLIRARSVRGTNMYDPNEVYQLKEIRESNTTLINVAARAARAEMTAYRLERKVTQLLNIIGADIPSADIEPSAVVALHLKVEQELELSDLPTVNTIMYWAQVFQSLSEEYFHVVAQEFGTEEPWTSYLSLSNQLLQSVQRKRLKNDLEFSTALDFLEMARRGMRQTMFFYVRSTSNKRIAYKLFPETLGDVHEDVLAMVSMIVD
jgi:hypothetical protein